MGPVDTMSWVAILILVLLAGLIALCLLILWDLEGENETWEELREQEAWEKHKRQEAGREARSQVLLAVCRHSVAWGAHVVDDLHPLSEAEADLAPSLRLGDSFELVAQDDAANRIGICPACDDE